METYLVGTSTCSQSRWENPSTLSSPSVASMPRNKRVHVWIVVYLWLAFQPILQVHMLEKSNGVFRDHLSSSLTSLSFFWKWRFAFLGVWDTVFFFNVIVAYLRRPHGKMTYGSNLCFSSPSGIQHATKEKPKTTWGWSLILVSFWAIFVHLGAGGYFGEESLFFH